MNRREFLKISMSGAAIASLIKPLGQSTVAYPWRLRVSLPKPGRPLWTAHVFDAKTGEDVSRMFPVQMAHRVFRSLRTGQPVRVALYRLGSDGYPLVEGPDRIAMKAATILVEHG